jgi:hypothetical protein
MEQDMLTILTRPVAAAFLAAFPLPVAAAPAVLAGPSTFSADTGLVRLVQARERRDLREERRELRRAQRSGDRGGVREERRDVRSAQRDLRDARRNLFARLTAAARHGRFSIH